MARHLFAVGRLTYHRLGCALKCGGCSEIWSNGRVRTHKGALVALNAGVCVPHRNFDGDAALFVLGGAKWEHSVVAKCANGELVAVQCGHGTQYVRNKRRDFSFCRYSLVRGNTPRLWIMDFF